MPGLRGARSVALSPDERFVYVAGSESNAIAVFERDETTGELTFVERVADGPARDGGEVARGAGGLAQHDGHPPGAALRSQ